MVVSSVDILLSQILIIIYRMTSIFNKKYIDIWYTRECLYSYKKKVYMINHSNWKRGVKCSWFSSEACEWDANKRYNRVELCSCILRLREKRLEYLYLDLNEFQMGICRINRYKEYVPRNWIPLFDWIISKVNNKCMKIFLYAKMLYEINYKTYSFSYLLIPNISR